MTASSSQTYVALNDNFTINKNTILMIMVNCFKDGATQQQVFNFLVKDQELTQERIGDIYQQVSREMSNMAREGHLDDSNKVYEDGNGNRHFSRTLYVIPLKRLPVRKTKTEELNDIIDDLRAQVKELNTKNEFLITRNERLEERLSKFQ